MRAHCLTVILALGGCTSTGGAPQIVGDGTDDSGSDSGQGADSSSDSGGGGNGGASGGPDGDTLGDDPVLWHGQRKVTYTAYGGRKCVLTIVEEGEQLYGPGYLQLERSCPTCERMFGLNLEVKGACITQGWAETATRGLDFQAGGVVDVYTVTQSGATYEASLLATGSWDGTTLTYAYHSSDPLYKDILLEGTATFE